MFHDYTVTTRAEVIEECKFQNASPVAEAWAMELLAENDTVEAFAIVNYAIIVAKLVGKVP